MKKYLLGLAPLLGLLTVLVIWQAFAQAGWLNTTLFPPPLRVALTLWELREDFSRALWESGRAILVSFFIASLSGIALALLLTTTEFLRRAFLPLAIFFQTVPIIAIAPLLVIYFGFGWRTVVASATIVSLFPVLASALVALTSTPAAELELFRFYQTSRAKTLWHLRLPQAYLGIYSGLRIAAGLAVIGAVAGEFVAGGGLGALIDSARTQQRIDIVFVCLLLLSFLGFSMITLLSLGHRALQKWRPLGLDLNE
jgi:NitT/TauT family transport system permease protein